MENKFPGFIARIKEEWSGGEPFRIMYEDEARFGRKSQEYTYAYGAVSIIDGEFDSLILPYVNWSGQLSHSRGLFIE